MNPQSKDERFREVSRATVDAKLLGVGFIAIHPDNSFEHVDTTRIAIKSAEDGAKFEDAVKPGTLAALEHAELQSLRAQLESLVREAIPTMQTKMGRHQRKAIRTRNARYSEQHLEYADRCAKWLALAKDLGISNERKESTHDTTDR